ncbi:MAG: DotU family type IV/VI secretion system protein [Deltaproteobacteria bacterium]|nr:DotU family type IV/VI secretion system protein [Deltaproteobacteria bacterium]
MRFASRFFGIFRLALEASEDEGRYPDWTSVSRELSSALAEEARLPLPPGFGPAERREALWPVLVWIDEINLNSRRGDARLWNDHSLQRSLLDTNVGGELFYRRLRALLSLRRRHLFLGREGTSLSAARLEGELAGGGFSGGPGAFRFPPGMWDGEPWYGEPRDGEYGSPGPADAPRRPGDGADGGPEDSASDYLPGNFRADEVPDAVNDEVTAAELVGLWVSPGDGPEPLESVLDTYAMCIILGFRGQFSPGAPAAGPGFRVDAPGGPDPPGPRADAFTGLTGGPAADREGPVPGSREDRELLKAVARRQMRSWSAKGVKPPEGVRKRGIWGTVADFWRDYDWVVYHVLIPLLALGAFYLHGAAIIENLPF